MGENDRDGVKPEDPNTRWAAERTLLAWVRTGLATMGFGFVVARFGLFLRELSAMNQVPQPKHPMLSLGIGVALVAIGILVNVYSAFEHMRVLQRIGARLPFQPPRVSIGPILAGGIALVGVAIILSLLRLMS